MTLQDLFKDQLRLIEDRNVSVKVFESINKIKTARDGMSTKLLIRKERQTQENIANGNCINNIIQK